MGQDPVYTTQIPGAASYAQADLLAKTAYQNALTRLNNQRMDTLRQYGYTANIDPTNGVLANMKVDPGNMYGQYQQLLGNAADQAQQAQEANAARGLVGGLANQGITAAHRAFGGASAQLGQNLNATLTDYQDQQLQAKWQYDQALWMAEQQAMLDAINSGNFNPADYGGYPDYGATPDYGSPDAGGPGGPGGSPSYRGPFAGASGGLANSNNPFVTFAGGGGLNTTESHNKSGWHPSTSSSAPSYRRPSNYSGSRMSSAQLNKVLAQQKAKSKSSAKKRR